MSLNLALLLRESAAKYPQKTALACGDPSLTYETVHLFAQRFAGGLTSLGVEPGQHVALLLPNVPHFTIAYFGSHYAGTPVVPLNVLLTADEIAYHLEDSEAVALVAWEGFLKAAEEGSSRVEHCRHLVVARANPTDWSAPEGAVNMAALIAAAEPVRELPATDPDDAAVILYTSGTTGKPKGAELTHFNLFMNAHMNSHVFGSVANDVTLAVLPMFHSFGRSEEH